MVLSVFRLQPSKAAGHTAHTTSLQLLGYNLNNARALLFGLVNVCAFLYVVIASAVFSLSPHISSINRGMPVCSNRQISGEEFVNFCGLIKKHEL